MKFTATTNETGNKTMATTQNLKGKSITTDIYSNPTKATITKVVNRNGRVYIYCLHEYGFGFKSQQSTAEVGEWAAHSLENPLT